MSDKSSRATTPPTHPARPTGSTSAATRPPVPRPDANTTRATPSAAGAKPATAQLPTAQAVQAQSTAESATRPEQPPLAMAPTLVVRARRVTPTDSILVSTNMIGRTVSRAKQATPPKAQAPVPKAQAPAPKAQAPVPKTQAPVPKKK